MEPGRLTCTIMRIFSIALEAFIIDLLIGTLNGLASLLPIAMAKTLYEHVWWSCGSY